MHVYYSSYVACLVSKPVVEQLFDKLYIFVEISMLVTVICLYILCMHMLHKNSCTCHVIVDVKLFHQLFIGLRLTFIVM